MGSVLAAKYLLWLFTSDMNICEHVLITWPYVLITWSYVLITHF